MKHVYFVWAPGHEQETECYFVKDKYRYGIPGFWWKRRRRLGVVQSWKFLIQRIGFSRFINLLMSR